MDGYELTALAVSAEFSKSTFILFAVRLAVCFQGVDDSADFVKAFAFCLRSKDAILRRQFRSAWNVF